MRQPINSSPEPRRLLTSPCPLCWHVFKCPYDEHYQRQCREFWPLSQVDSRQLRAVDADQEKLRRTALWIPWVEDMVRTWESGGRITDGQYLRLRREVFRDGPTRMDQVYLYVIGQFLHVGLLRHLTDAVCYYRLTHEDMEKIKDVAMTAIQGALIVPREDVVSNDGGSPVVSHFERLAFDVLKMAVRGLLGVPELTLPEQDEAFMDEFEREWARAMSFGNGYFGLTIIPIVSILDMVRYQQLGGRNRVISRSLVEYLIVLMDTHPHTVQLVAPKFREVALKERLVSMFDPLVGKCASQAAERLEAAGERHAKAEYPLRVEEFRAVLSAAIDEYCFMYGKPGTIEDGIGMLGLSTSLDTRLRVELVLEMLDLPVDVAELVHVNATNYIQARLRAHLREHHPVRRQAAVSLDQSSDDDERSTLGELIGDTEGAGAVPVHQVTVAHTVEGVQYLYTDQMAGVAAVSSDRLRHWDRDGTLEALRVRDIVKDVKDRTEAMRRIYPYTDKMIAEIHRVARVKQQQRGEFTDGMYSRRQVAKALRISYRTLQRWEEREQARPIWRDGGPAYSLEEVRRLAALMGLSPPDPDPM